MAKSHYARDGERETSGTVAGAKLTQYDSGADCKGGWTGGNHPQKWQGQKGGLDPVGVSYWCDYPQKPCC
jgi:hypothetical protein